MRLPKFIVGAAFAAILATGTTVYAQSDVMEACNYTQTPQENPDPETTNCLLTETALAYDVPPEIVKAIAEEENNGWKHFDGNGDVIIGNDGGIGIMQVTNKTDYNEELLKSDIAYNIQAGVEILNSMFARDDLPTVNNGNRDVIDNWYFAVMAYDGLVFANIPFILTTGERNAEAYQERVFDNVKEHSLLSLDRPVVEDGDIKFITEADEEVIFMKERYQLDEPGLWSNYHFKPGKTLETRVKLNIRRSPSSTAPSVKFISSYQKVTITGEYVYDKIAPHVNHFVWYPVETSEGTKGYIPSSYFIEVPYRFVDVGIIPPMSTSIYYLVDRHLIKGVSENKFGYGDPLTREQAAILMTRVENISVGNAPDPDFTDVPKNYKYHEAIAAAVDAGIFSGVSETRFAPQATLTRREMVVVLQNVFELPATNTTHPFTDIEATWYEDALDRLYAAEIAMGTTNTTFSPKEVITREQFALFLVRALRTF